MSLFTEEVNDPLKSRTFTNWNLYRERTFTEVLDLLKHTIKVSMLFVHHGNKKDPGNSPGLAVFPNAFSANLDA